MPIVPGEFVQSVMPQGQLAYQDIHATPAEFGGQLAHTLDLAGKRLGRDAIVQQRIDASSVNDVYANQFDPAIRGLCQNYLNIGGKDALEKLPDYREQMTDLAAQLRDGLPNDVQRHIFDLISRQRLTSDFDAMTRHAAASLNQWQTETADAMSDAFARGIVDNRLDFDKVAGPRGLIQSIKNLNESHSGLTGEDASISGLRATASIDKGLSDAILTEAQTNPVGAKSFYDQYQQYLSSDVVRDHVLGNLSPILSDALKTSAYNDAVARFGAPGALAGVDAAEAMTGPQPTSPPPEAAAILAGAPSAATAYVMDPANYQDLEPDQRREVARAVQAEWVRQNQARDDSQKAANDNLEVGAITGKISRGDVLGWRDPKTRFAASQETLQDVGKWLANPVRATQSNPDALVGIASGIAGRRLTATAPINEAFRSGAVSQPDWTGMRDLLNTYQDPAKSRWFDYATSAFNTKYADPSSPNGVNPDAFKLFPSFLMDLNSAVRDQDLKGTQIRDATNKLLNDVANLLPPWASAIPAEAAENPSPNDTNTTKNINADPNVVDSNGKPDQPDKAQGGTGGASSEAAGPNGDKSNDSEMVLAKDFGGLGLGNRYADSRIQDTAKQYGVTLSHDAADALRKEMNDNEADKLQDDNISGKEKLNTMQNIGHRVLNDPDVPKGVKSELQNVANQIGNALK